MDIKSEDLISPEYLALQIAMHAAPRGYGGKGDRWAGAVFDLARGLRAVDVLDYGSGQGSLGRVLRVLGLEVFEYDPVMAPALPAPADLVVCTDVLEHIESDRIDRVLEHLCSLTRKVAFVSIALTEAGKDLPDGRNAHLLVHSPAWWRVRLQRAGFIVEPVHIDHKHMVAKLFPYPEVSR
jgi:hypothetical protein